MFLLRETENQIMILENPTDKLLSVAESASVCAQKANLHPLQAILVQIVLSW